jgi:hypothetical protein
MAFSRAGTAQRKKREIARGERKDAGRKTATGWEAEARRVGFLDPLEAFPGGEDEWREWNNG